MCIRDRYKTLTADAEKIRAIEQQIAALAPAEDAASSAAAQGNEMCIRDR